MTDNVPPSKFELDRLISYSDDEIISEIKRVISVFDKDTITKSDFDKLSKVHSSTVIRRFGGWRQALAKCGHSGKYSGTTVTEKMRAQLARTLSNENIIQELRRIAAIISPEPVTIKGLAEHSSVISSAVVRGRFGSFKNGLRAAGLTPSPLGNRYTEEEYFENLLTVWTHYGRPPKYAEMGRPPSRISPGAYEKRFGTWSGARLAFVAKMNSETTSSLVVQTERPKKHVAATATDEKSNGNEARKIRASLRWAVFNRDRFRCVICGQSPATKLGCQLHIDHIIPVAKGGGNNIENLRILCADCNLGKGIR